ncbi:unnamed protein product [Closterium sp. NIES-53]
MQTSQKQYADRQRRDHSVAVGDQVLLDTRNLNLSHLPSKLRPRFCGPFLVAAQVTPVTFRLRLPDTWKLHNAFHVQLLKPYKDPNQHSSCETEIYAGAMAAQELRWLTYLLTDLGERSRSSPVLYVDNKAMIALSQEHRLEHRTKHIALRYFLARELQ